MHVKDAILAAGVALLKDKGIAALTQPQIARAAGIKQSHLTYYYPTRTELLLAIAEHSLDATTARIAPRTDAGTAPAGLADFAAQLAEAMIAGIPPRLIVGLIVAADAEPGIRSALREFVTHVRGRLQALLTTAGVAADDETTLLFHAGIVGLAIMHQARLSPESEREVDAGIAALMRRLANSAEPTTPGTKP